MCIKNNLEDMNTEQKVSSLTDSRTKEKTSLSNGIITSQPISGWLWCPENFPSFSRKQLEQMATMSYQELAQEILWAFDFWISTNDLEGVITQAYWEQWHHEDITPVTRMWDTNLYSLHLGYGPTFAFKNVALEFLPRHYHGFLA